MNKNPSSPLTVIRFPVNARFTIQSMGYIRYSSPWTHFPRCCDEYILYFIESGDLYVEEDGVKWHAGENTALLLEPGKFHRGYKSAVVSYFYIHFTCSEPLTSGVLTDELKEQIIALRVNFLNSTWGEHQWHPSPYDGMDLHFPKLSSLGGSYDFFQSLRYANQIFFESFEGRRSLVALRLQELITMICREFVHTCINPSSTRILVLVRDIRHYIDQHYADNITSQDISGKFHVNYDYANRQFKRYTGQSIHSYLIAVRMHRARRLLSADVSVSETAAQVGIEDAAYFSRLFKKQTGQSPSEYVENVDYADRER